MKIAVVKIELEYEFPSWMSNTNIYETVENQELPEKYREDSWEFVRIIQEVTNESHAK